MDFLKCSLDPFNSKGSLGAPDGFAGSSLIVDHRYKFNVEASAAGNIGLAVLPTLPGSLYIGEGNCALPSWGGVSAPTNYGLNNVTGTYWGVPYQEYNGVAPVSTGVHAWNLGNGLTNPFLASRARILALSCRITPTTQLLQSSGNIFVGQFSDDNQYAGSGKCNTETNGTIIIDELEGSYPCRYSILPDADARAITQIRGYVQQYIADGIYAVGKRVDPDLEFHNWAPFQNQLVPNQTASYLARGVSGCLWQVIADTDGLVANGLTTGAGVSTASSNLELGYIVEGVPTTANTCDSAGPCFIDPGMSSILVGIEGMQASGASVPTFVEVEVQTCVEYQIRPFSSVNQFQKVAPKQDPVAMELFNELTRRMPTAMPAGAVNGSWAATLKSILSGIKVGGSALSAVGVPYAGAAAGLAEQFSSMYL